MSPFALSWSAGINLYGRLEFETARCGPLMAIVEHRPDIKGVNQWAWDICAPDDEGEIDAGCLDCGEAFTADAAKLAAEAALGTIALEMMTALGLPVAV